MKAWVARLSALPKHVAAHVNTVHCGRKLVRRSIEHDFVVVQGIYRLLLR